MNPKASIPEKDLTSPELKLDRCKLVLTDKNIQSSVYLNGTNKNWQPPVKRIMIADDDPAIIDVVTLMLEAAGYEVYSSANNQTFADVTAICPDLILLDIMMSGINGLDICKKLKNQQITKHIPVIMISANKQAGEIAKHACADDFISKPFEMQALLQKVTKYVHL